MSSSIPGEKSTGKRTLSSTTLNMRFMQRKTMRESTAKSGHEQLVVHSEEISDLSSAEQSSRSHLTATVHLGEPVNTSDPKLISASPSDMFGDIIGRRSFNMFNRAVEESYKKELEARRRHDQEHRALEETISDDELLRRYDLYVKGKINTLNDPSVMSGNAMVNTLQRKVAQQNQQKHRVN